MVSPPPLMALNAISLTMLCEVPLDDLFSNTASKGAPKTHQMLEEARKDPPQQVLEGARPGDAFSLEFYPPEL